MKSKPFFTVFIAMLMLAALACVAWAGELDDLKLEAEQGNASAQSRLGALYGNGDGVPQDYVEAAKWYQRAAEQGDVFGQCKLSISYVLGKGVIQDLVLAYMWINLASAQDPSNIVVRDIIAKNMSPSQIAEGQRLSREWKSK